MRVEPHGDGLRLTVTIHPDIAQRSTAKPYNFTQIGDAMAAIENFLIEYARSSTDRAAGPS